ncbi:hypothetical protein [Kribbella sp. NPDC006257]|uniref:hypothetical protein n=1 Tax=Kribbella sp. NPDC006257 TaxID=3156738 RepID=UPI0033A9292D
MALDRDADLALRLQIMDRLTYLSDQSGGVVTREQLTSLDVNSQRRRIIDQSGGIWNPSDLNASLSILSSPTGPYNDGQVQGGYAYKAGSIGFVTASGSQATFDCRSRLELLL